MTMYAEIFDPLQETKMRELDESLGDLLGQQADRVVDILELEVCKWVRAIEPILLQVDDIVAELDWYVKRGRKPSSYHGPSSVLALASACQTFNLVRPRMVEENVLLIKGGRHILYEMANETYVSNDTDLRGSQPRSMEGEHTSADPDDRSLVSWFLLHSYRDLCVLQSGLEDDSYRCEW